MSLLLNNTLLQAAEQKIESQLVPATRANYMKVVVAGMKVAMQNGPNGLLASLHNSKDPLGDCAKGAINLCLLMSRQSRGTMPQRALVPAAMTLMLHALDFVDKTGVMKIGNAELVQATHIFTNFLFKQLNITPQMLSTAAGKVHAVMQDPAKMQAIQTKAGFVKHPGASELTTQPGAENGV